MLLLANLHWTQNQKYELPSVQVYTEHTLEYYSFRFKVAEPLTCYRAEIYSDGGPCFQDSCVEIFLKESPKTENYFNFEFNSLGFCLAEQGNSKKDRTPFSNKEYKWIKRMVVSPQHHQNYVYWAIKVSIPKHLFNYPKHAAPVGNLYKCANLAITPHYLSLYPIYTPDPDFHRPEYFGLL